MTLRAQTPPWITHQLGKKPSWDTASPEHLCRQLNRRDHRNYAVSYNWVGAVITVAAASHHSVPEIMRNCTCPEQPDDQNHHSHDQHNLSRCTTTSTTCRKCRCVQRSQFPLVRGVQLSCPRAAPSMRSIAASTPAEPTNQSSASSPSSRECRSSESTTVCVRATAQRHAVDKLTQGD